jgi:C-terminal binding protein
MLTFVQNDDLENQIFAENPTHKYKINYLQTGLFPTGTQSPKPWSAIPQELRDRVDAIMTLKMSFTAADVKLFPKLKV